MPEKFYRADKFNEFPWNELVYGEYKTNGKNYNFSKGGIHYVNGSGWQITIYKGENDLESETYELPKALSDMLDHQEEWGREESQREIRNTFKSILGI